MDEFFTDCETGAVAVQTAALAAVAIGLAAFAFAAAYVVRTIKGWRTWTGDDK